ncbi:hypothetical protein [Curtobacterium sp. MCBA15_001]|uniref:hypothetical protein n=1 Tax=Curtobacterium sp. MCBA15_001 TaxID=1898731 RepID=UPI0008DD88FE|nr:hypothetical protein [Curtobacterium sp. MCBA15_001]OIH94444.1 hypothetical protein BIU90_04710 [Curtobacterium sp. MCBA15_001]
MNDGVLVTGLREYRAHRSEVLDPTRVRRRRVVSGAAAALAGTVLVVSQMLSGWTGAPALEAVVGLVASAAAVGCLVAVFCRTGRTASATRSAPLPGGWRRSERIGAQFSARPPELLPEDRDAVLARAAEVVAPAVVTVDRLRWIPAMWLAAWVGGIALGLASQSVVALLLPPVFALVQGGTTITAVVWLGRAELTRRRVVALPPIEPESPLRPRNPEPRGSKVVLPDE